MTFQTGRKERVINYLKLFWGGFGYKLYRMEYANQDGQQDISEQDHRIFLWEIFIKKNIYLLEIGERKLDELDFFVLYTQKIL